MIVLENRLAEAFATLPEIGNKKPVYRWGNEEHLIKQIVQFQKANRLPYPLIYQISNVSTYDKARNMLTAKVSFVIATRNEATAQLNENRWALNYKDVLFPVADYMCQLFKKGSIFLWNEQSTLTEFPNYGTGEKNKTVDIWDALRLDTTIKINSNCLKTVFYKIQ